MLARCSCAPLRLAYDKRSPKSVWVKARKYERAYATQLRKIAHSIDTLCKQFNPDEWASNHWIVTALEQYAKTIEPWAEAVGAKMVAEVAIRDRNAWREIGQQIGRSLHREIEQAPTGHVMRQRLADQVDLITSLPREAGERVHALTIEGISNGTRAKEIAAKIFETGEVSRSRASLIGRTEVSRTATELVRARAEYIGSTSYIWRTAGDSDVRRDHKALSGKVFDWSSPPVADARTGARAHPGCIYNCRCYPELILED